MWNLTPTNIALGDKNFEGFIDNNGKHYFAERIPIYGILDFGFVQSNTNKLISLAANNITSPIILESIIATAPGQAGDQVEVHLYRNGQPLAFQIFGNDEIPLDHPCTVLTPDIEVEVKPKYDCTIFMYFKPVHLLFRAIPT